MGCTFKKESYKIVFWDVFVATKLQKHKQKLKSNQKGKSMQNVIKQQIKANEKTKSQTNYPNGNFEKQKVWFSVPSSDFSDFRQNGIFSIYFNPLR